MQHVTPKTTFHHAGHRRRRTPIALFGALLIAVAWLMAMPVHAATSTVATCDEAALRAAVDDAAPGDTITFGCSGTITLTAAGGGPISIDKNLTLDGSGQSVTISGGGSVGVIEIGSGVTVTLRALTIANGADGVAAGGYGIYGGILNAGTLNLIESTVSNNTALAGTGGIRNWGTLNITGSTITGNRGIVAGLHQVNGTLNITDSIFSGNIGATTTVYSTTGAIVLSNGSATVSGSTFVGNVGDMAGGINMGLGTTLAVTNSTFSGNASRSLDSAGAIWNDYGSLAVTNSTIVDNFAPHSLYGGSMWFNAGGIVSFPVAPISLANSILAGNTGEFGGNCMFGAGVPDAGGNLSDDISCEFTQGSSQNNATMLNLGPLGDNGGPTPTIALGAGSAAIDAGSCLQATDQRGLPRPGAGGTLCDSGAFELQNETAPSPQAITFTSTPPVDAVSGGTYEVSATGGGSGNPVVFSIDASASSVCSVTGSTVSFIGIGTCTVNANQSGDANYLGAPQASQGFPVSQATQTVTFTSAAPADATYGGTYEVSATGGGSGNPVVFSIDASAGNVCSVTGSTVSFIGIGTCTVNANQAGDGNHLDAPQASQGFQVSQAPQTIAFGALSDRTFGDPDFAVAASASSGLAVTFSATGNCTVSGATVHLIAAGVCTITADQAGDANYAPAPSVGQSFLIASADLTPPVLIATQNPLPNSAGWNNADVTVSWTCSDTDSGADLAASTLGDDVMTASGTAQASCTDLAGNMASASHAVLIDKVAPVLTATQSPSANANGWNNADVTVRWNCSDTDSGADLAASTLGDDVLSASGTAQASCTDLAGNTVNASYAVLIDKTAPVLTATQSPSANANGWNNADVTVGWTCTDGDSGVDHAATTLADDVMTASGTAQASCTDLAGNTVSATYAVLIDKTAPVLAATQSPLANANGWNNADVTVSWTCSDADSGADLAASMLGDDVMTASGTAQASCTDLAGNTVSASHAVLIDKTAASIAVSSPQPWSVNAIGLQVFFSATDELSGVGPAVANLDDGVSTVAVANGHVVAAAGVYRLTVVATDAAGNEASEVVDFVVYDPVGGSVSGGGQFTSPVGALRSDPGFAGPAFFAFHSSYKRGATVPTGTTGFWVQTNLFRFMSDSYEWLVVNQGGTGAQFKGTGKVDGGYAPNGTAYKFMVWATDGNATGDQPGTFRIKVWYEIGGIEIVVYDNGVEQPIEAGSITIKSR